MNYSLKMTFNAYVSPLECFAITSCNRDGHVKLYVSVIVVTNVKMLLMFLMLTVKLVMFHVLLYVMKC